MIVLTPNSNPLTAGSSVEVCIEGGTPNSTVKVTIDNGRTPVTEDCVSVSTDANGNGCVTWTVWSELQARFNAPGCQEKARQVVQPIG